MPVIMKVQKFPAAVKGMAESTEAEKSEGMSSEVRGLARK